MGAACTIRPVTSISPHPATPGAPRWHPGSMALHWLLALMILGSLVVGLTMTGLPFSPMRLKLYNWHKWAGVTILGLSALRLLWRLTHRAPVEAPMPAWQRRAAHGAHAALYGLFFAVPLAGWAYSSAAGFPVVLFGTLPLPDFVGPDRALSETLKPLHRWLAYMLAAVAALHVAAALKHHFIDRDGLLLRMMPARRRGGPSTPPSDASP
ncbi:MAG: cytochrome b [Rubrivivax sp.]|nr:cytochrome b [Rubrivivax sp.]